MPLSKEVRLLQSKWVGGQGWPKRLEWIEIDGIRGWTGQRIEFQFPVVAIVGENGVGKSTILQAVAASYQSEGDTGQFYASDFFPDTPWETVSNATIRTSIREGGPSKVSSVRKPSDRWRGNVDRFVRRTDYVDLRRIQPIAARVGYARMAKREVQEAEIEHFDAETVSRLSSIMGRAYGLAKLSKTNVDENRSVPVLWREGKWFSGFHGGAGETAMAELLQRQIHKYSIILIDEIETSFHPRTQRRLLRDLATLARHLEVQFVLTTHSPYILMELPPEARIYVMESEGEKKIITGVSPEFAMTQMDEDIHPEADVYVEDHRASVMVNEIVASTEMRDLVRRYQIVPFGAANVGRSLGQMIFEKRFPRASIVFLDGDQPTSAGCNLLPGGDAPERVVFESLQRISFGELGAKLNRSPSDVAEFCTSAMMVPYHHEWVRMAADRLALTGDVLWQQMCAEWAKRCLTDTEKNGVADAIYQAIALFGGSMHVEAQHTPRRQPLQLTLEEGI